MLGRNFLPTSPKTQQIVQSSVCTQTAEKSFLPPAMSTATKCKKKIQCYTEGAIKCVEKREDK